MGPGGRDPMFPVQFRPVESFMGQGMPPQAQGNAYGVPFNPLGAPANPASQPAPARPAGALAALPKWLQVFGKGGHGAR